MQCLVDNKWCLRPSEVEILFKNEKGSKVNWWAKNLLTGEFFDYGSQIGGRIRGDKPFCVELEMDEGEYMFACGDYNIIDPQTQRHCSQVFYVLVNENGATVCKKSELPSKGGNGHSQSSGQTSWGSNGGSAWGKKPVAKKEEYFEFSSHKACLNDMLVHGDNYTCEQCELTDPSKPPTCNNCSHGTPIYVKKD